ncbi:hypothetical protein [Flavobacterium faecale]|nr:hypothetical protein [Flavobacterium faecale]
MQKIVSLLFLSLILVSCSSKLDFDQVNDLKLEPVIVANLSYFDIAAPDFVTNGQETIVSGSLQNFDVFRDSFFRDNLVQSDFFFEITNTINRQYRLNLLLLNSQNRILYSINFNVSASAGTPQVVTQKEIFKDVKLDLLKQSQRIAYHIIMLPGKSLTAASTGHLIFKSSATVYMDIQ